MYNSLFKFRLLLLLAALALFVVSCNDDNEPEDKKADPFVADFIEEINADSIGKYIQWLEDKGTRFALAPNHRQVAVDIQKKFIQFGYTDTKLDSFEKTMTYRSVPYREWHYNVVATLQGITNPDSICIMGGHYDNITSTGDPFTLAPGANDNASGVAVTLEVARVIRKRNFTPNTTFKFIAFAAEELGLHGSGNFAYNAATSQMKIKMMLNNDMVGFWPVELPDYRVNIIDYDNSVDLRHKAEQGCDLYTTLLYNNDNTYQRYSDSYPFSQYDYKAIFFISNADDHNYHTVNDLTSFINPDFCREVAKVNCVLLIENNGN